MTDGQISDLTTVQSPPRRTLAYEQIQVDDGQLGTGGQGVVYRARVQDEPDLDRIALKEPVDRGTVTGDAVDAFLREARTWATIDRREREKPRWAESEHIVGIVDSGETLPWIAMEYMDGGSLAGRLTDTPDGLPIDEALWIGEAICRGVELAHNYGVAHLDLKPSNVLFRNTGADTWDVPKVADWGLSRVLAEETQTIDGVSVRYAAPEQFEPDEFGDPDMLTDVYQAGAVVYAMLTGRPPYDGGHASVMYDVVHGDESVPPSALRDEVPDRVDQAVLTALATAKRDRYDAIQVFKQALRAGRLGHRPPQIVASKLTDTTERSHTAPQSNSDTETGVSEPPTASVPDTTASDSGPNEANTTAEAQRGSTRPANDNDGSENKPSNTSQHTADPDGESDRLATEQKDGDAGEDEDSERADADGWFHPRGYPEASDRPLGAGLRAIDATEPADSIAEGLQQLPADSLESALNRLQSDGH